MDYLHVLQRLQHDTKGEPLSPEQLSFVLRVLEAVPDCSADNPLSDVVTSSLLIPDSSGRLRHVMDLVYNDAPWLERNSPAAKDLIHPSISNDLAERLGVQSLRCMSLVDNEMTKELPCMDYGRICELLALYGDGEFLLFDLLELADCCKAKKLHLIHDKREHPRQSLLQHNLGEFQGPSLLVIMEGATLTRDEVCSLQFPPPWKLKGSMISYGLGLLSCHVICDILSVVSCGYLYMFDPLGLALAPPSSNNPSAKMFSLIGTNLTERFRDQFHPMLINGESSLFSSDTTIIRMPLSSRIVKECDASCGRVKQIFDRFMDHASSTLLFLKSVLQVSLSTWEEGSVNPSLDYSISIDPSSAVMRNPFLEKNWRKFHISRLFSSSSAATKLHVVDLNVFRGGSDVVEKWLIVLSLGSGQTRNMALDRRYLSYDLKPVAGVALHISQNGQQISAHSSSCILSPLPLSGDIPIPVTAMGCFLVCHNGGRYLFTCQDGATSSEQQRDNRNQLIEAWNKELLLCVRDSYVQLVLEFQKLKKDPLSSSIESNSAHTLSFILQAYGDRIYSFWPRSKQRSLSTSQTQSDIDNASSFKATEADWLCLIEQVIIPFYERLVDLPVWQLYRGDLVKADEGMFLSQTASGTDDNLPPARVCSFIREHYPVFSVPSEFVHEIQAAGVKVREIKPKMVRDLLKASESILLRSIETYIDVLDYCLADIHLLLSSISYEADASGERISLDSVGNVHAGNRDMHASAIPSSSNPNMQRSHYTDSHNIPGGDALEIMTSFGRALYDIGRGVVEDFGRVGGHIIQKNAAGGGSIDSDQTFRSIALELKGIPFPTATKNLARLGITELWVGTKEQQSLMHPLEDNFIHPECLERPVLVECLSKEMIHCFLKLQQFSPHLLSRHLRSLFSKHWVNHVINSKKTPWFSWENKIGSTGEEPSPEWIQLFWKVFKADGDLSLVSEWPLIPASLSRPILCRVEAHDLVFIPPIIESAFVNGSSVSERNLILDSSGNSINESELMELYFTSFKMIKSRHPWLFLLLNKCNIPIYDMSFLDHGAPRSCFPSPGQSLGQVVASRLLAIKNAGYFSEPESFSHEDRDRLFTLFASEFKSSTGFVYKREELDVLRTLPIFKTATGSYTRLHNQDQCIISSGAFFHPSDERCLSNSVDGSLFYRALGVSELHDQDILLRFALPGFEGKTLREQEDILMYLYMNWQDLQLDSAVVNTLKETCFVRNANDFCVQLFKPRDLLDTSDVLLTSVFSEERNRFPGERFCTDGWLRILRKVGLRTSSEADMIVECARKLEQLGSEAMKYAEDIDDFEAEFSGSPNGISSDLFSLAGSVVEAVFANFAVLYDNTFCGLLGEIAFVPAEKGLPSIGGKKGGKRVLASYNEAILLKDWPLAWSCSPILTRQNVVPPEYSWGAFHLRSPPAFSTVLKHLQVIGRNNGEDTLAHWPTSSGMMTIEEASFEILRYLDKIWGSLSSSDILELQKVAFVPVANGTRLVTANSLFARLAINLSPFAFELPAVYLPYMKILKDIGIQDILSVSYVKDLLLNIQKSCGYQRLNPNELRAVMEILHFVCDGANRAGFNGSDWVSDAIVLDDGCRLVLASSCVYADAYGSQYLSHIDSSRLRFVHPALLESMCMTLGIKKLSEIVVEELEEEQQLLVLNEIRSVPVKSITDKLLSKSLQEAIWIVINSLVDHVAYFEGLTFRQLRMSLLSVAEKLQFVQCLHTRFFLLPNFLDITCVTKGSAIPEWEGSSTKHHTTHFVDKSQTRILIAEPPSFMSLYEIIAVVVSQVLGSPTTLPIAPLFSSPGGSEKAIVNMLKLGSERQVAENEGRNSVLVGKELLPQDALHVQFHPLRPFYTGEIVAWRTGKDGEKLKYGRIPEDVRPSSGQALYRFSVETAPGEIQSLLSSQVFSFKGVSVAGATSSSSLPKSSQIKMENRLTEHVLQDAGPCSASSQRAKELQYGRVSAEELVQAVHDMLSAAGFSLDIEKQTLMQTTLSLQEQLKESQVALLVEQEKADSAAREADAAKAAWSCRICLSAEVEVSIIPCGHVLCLRCSSAVSRCPFCRLQVSKTMKIFRP